MKPVEFGVRISAFILDVTLGAILAILLIQFFVGPLALDLYEYRLEHSKKHTVTQFLRIMGIFLGFSMEAFLSASLGKKIMGLQVARENGMKANFSVRLLRYFLKNLVVICFLFSFLSIQWLGSGWRNVGDLTFAIALGWLGFVVLGTLMIWKRERWQNIYDRLSGTSVFWKKDIQN